LICLLAAGCDYGGGPEVTAGRLELTVVTEAEAYDSAAVALEGNALRLERTGDRWRGDFDNVSFGVRDLTLRFYRPSQIAGEQTTTRLDEATTQVDFRGEPVAIDMAEVPNVTPLVELVNEVATAMLVDDPCVLETRIASALPAVDVDRALYGNTFDDLITFVFASTEDNDGGNLFDLAEGRDAFLATCRAGDWQLADTLACVFASTTLHCLHYVWQRED
jgi:hypothetical protein